MNVFFLALILVRWCEVRCTRNNVDIRAIFLGSVSSVGAGSCGTRFFTRIRAVFMLFSIMSVFGHDK